MPFIFVRPLYKDVTILSNSYMTEGMQTLLHIHSHQIWTYIYITIRLKWLVHTIYRELSI